MFEKVMGKCYTCLQQFQTILTHLEKHSWDLLFLQRVFWWQVWWSFVQWWKKWDGVFSYCELIHIKRKIRKQNFPKCNLSVQQVFEKKLSVVIVTLYSYNWTIPDKMLSRSWTVTRHWWDLHVCKLKKCLNTCETDISWTDHEQERKKFFVKRTCAVPPVWWYFKSPVADALETSFRVNASTVQTQTCLITLVNICVKKRKHSRLLIN